MNEHTTLSGMFHGPKSACKLDRSVKNGVDQ